MENNTVSRNKINKFFFDKDVIKEISSNFRTSVNIIYNPENNKMGFSINNSKENSQDDITNLPYKHMGSIPGLYPEWLGNRRFQEVHQTRFCYVGGAMARGIASSNMVIKLAENGCLGFYGSAGVSLQRIKEEIQKIAFVYVI